MHAASQPLINLRVQVIRSEGNAITYITYNTYLIKFNHRTRKWSFPVSSKRRQRLMK